MPDPVPAPLPASAGWLIPLLDMQTLWWRALERQAATLWQPWLGPAAPPFPAQPLLDAARGLALLGPAALQQLWLSAAQQWVDALRHDAAQA